MQRSSDLCLHITTTWQIFFRGSHGECLQCCTCNCRITINMGNTIAESVWAARKKLHAVTDQYQDMDMHTISRYVHTQLDNLPLDMLGSDSFGLLLFRHHSAAACRLVALLPPHHPSVLPLLASNEELPSWLVA